jgi:DnaJ-class molecular chaperone
MARRHKARRGRQDRIFRQHHNAHQDVVLRLRGKGLQQFGAGGHGDLNLRIQVHNPEKSSADERALFEQLRGLGQTGKQKRCWCQ